MTYQADGKTWEVESVDEEETTHYGKWIHGYLGYEDCINPIEILFDVGER